jgi:hypothetical protein
MPKFFWRGAYSFFHTTRLAGVIVLCLSGVCGKVEVSSKTLDTA